MGAERYANGHTRLSARLDTNARRHVWAYIEFETKASECGQSRWPHSAGPRADTRATTKEVAEGIVYVRTARRQ